MPAPDMTCPSVQLAPDSYLAKTLNVGNLTLHHKDPDNSYLLLLSSSDSSSGSGDSSLPPSDDDLDSGSAPSSNRGRRNRRKQGSRKTKKARRNRSLSSSTGDERLKPVPPRNYNGTPNECVFTRFVHESRDYVHSGRVKSTRQVWVISRFLEGRARQYYERTVGKNPFGVSLTKFFKGLFDDCFPREFRTLQRERLATCIQRDRSVKQYIQELSDLLDSIGDETERGKVLRLWRGL
jgi:hypothetical protein